MRFGKGADEQEREQMRSTLTALGLSLVILPGCGVANAPDRSRLAEMRPGGFLPVAVRPQEEPRPVARAQARPAEFQRWIEGFRPRALSAGITPGTFDRAFGSVTFLPDVIERDRSQPEFTRPIWTYLDSAVSDTRIENGRAALRDHGRVLDEIAARFGVEREIVVAVWGLESSYGTLRGSTSVISAMATLAHDGRRRDFFETQLIAALRILQAGDTTPERMVGSWAGAMGHTQFIPTSYLAYAVDFRGDGRRDIWSDDPADALASAANYLARHGWVRGQPPVVEVVLPRGFDMRAAGSRRDVAAWRAAGVEAVGGARLPASGNAELFFPAGVRGPAFLTFENFRVIKRYNNSDAYALAIAHLADRLRGAGPIRGAWPRDDRPLTADERRELQQRLTARGYDTGGVDGRVGPMTVAAVRAFQSSAGMVPDGFVSMDLLARLRR
jgi:membrane-bound lytic murein transglycosylase B